MSRKLSLDNLKKIDLKIFKGTLESLKSDCKLIIYTGEDFKIVAEMEKDKRTSELELWELIEKVKSKFKIKRNEKHDQTCFDLRYWGRGMWSIEVTDDWHKWIDAGIDMPNELYYTPHAACRGFLKYIEDNKINLRKLQSK